MRGRTRKGSWRPSPITDHSSRPLPIGLTTIEGFATLADLSPNSKAVSSVPLSPPQSPLEAACELAPLIRASADETDASRELPRPLFNALADAGMFRLALPRAIGGMELDYPTYVQVIEEIGKADAST